MPHPVKIIIGKTTLLAELFDTPCAQSIMACLPIETRPSDWGDEFYFQIPVNHPLDSSATAIVKVGDIGYWPPGQALALFFGPTPMSTGPDPVPASKVNLVGRIIDDPRLLKNEKGADKIRIEQG
jgi:uncharacterized protein